MKNHLLALALIISLLSMQIAYCQDYPIAHNDTIEFTFPIQEDTVDITDLLLSNDYWPDSIEVNFFFGGPIIIAQIIEEGYSHGYDKCLLHSLSLTNKLFGTSGVIEAGEYIIKNNDSLFPNINYLDEAIGKVYFKINNGNHAFLDINNISTQINNFGNQFWNMEEARFEVPKGDSTHSMFAASLWVGGLDENDSLHMAAQMYRYGPDRIGKNDADYWAGPVSESYDEVYDEKWKHYIWKLNREEILYHKNHWQDAGYEPIDPILTWPAHGDVNQGQEYNLAPFFDYDSDGNYNPYYGDYPLIRGDQTIFFIFNDSRNFHAETTGIPLGVEVHAMAYAYDKPSDSVLNNTIFFHYDIYNRSDTTYYNTYLGLFADIDIGEATDDYVRSNISEGIFYGYNGDSIDGDSTYGYGLNPPAQAVQIIAGPLIDSDNLDNPAFESDCSVFDFSASYGDANRGYAINGLHFGDGIIDNERMGMSGFVYFNNNNSGSAGSYMDDPEYASEYYNYIRRIWRDGTNMIYGGNGHLSAGGYGPRADFMFPGESDTCFWGTSGIAPDGEITWTEETAGNEFGDRRGLGIMGPFTFEAGSKEQLDIAYVWARSEIDELSSENLLMNHVSTINTMAQNNELELEQPGEIIGINEKPNNSSLKIKVYPNPTNGILYVEGDRNQLIEYSLFDMTGRKIETKHFISNQIILPELDKGLYILKLETKGRMFIIKFIYE